MTKLEKLGARIAAIEDRIHIVRRCMRCGHSEDMHNLHNPEQCAGNSNDCECEEFEF